MLISDATAGAIRDGSVRTQYRRWDAPRVRAGGTQLTAAGVVRFTRVTRVDDVGRITDRAASDAGFPDAATLRRALSSTSGAHVYRVHVVWAGEDPRIALRSAVPDTGDLMDIRRRLARLDARATGAWTDDVLRWIRQHPRVVSKELAALRAVELQPLKSDIRKLKALGLTVSHDVGYELSPRGAAYLAWRDETTP